MVLVATAGVTCDSEVNSFGGNMLLVRREVLCYLGNKDQVPGSFQGVGEFDVFGLTRVGGLQISVDREDPLWSWHLQEKICVVGNHHELGKGGSSQVSVFTAKPAQGYP